MTIHFEGDVSDKHPVKWQRNLIHCLWPLQLWNLVIACAYNRPYLGLLSYVLLGYCICFLCYLKEESLFYKLYRIIKEVEKC